MIDWTNLPDFSRSEFVCHCGCGREEMTHRFMESLQSLRSLMAFRFVISSGYRCPKHNAAESPKTGETGPHTTGRACDILIRGEDALALVIGAAAFGFTGFGIKQHGDDRFIHLDNLEDHETDGPRPWVWSYR